MMAGFGPERQQVGSMGARINTNLWLRCGRFNSTISHSGMAGFGPERQQVGSMGAGINPKPSEGVEQFLVLVDLVLAGFSSC